MEYKPLPTGFYEQDDVVSVARQLLGKFLWTDLNGKVTAGRIVETEAYSYLERACHAHLERRTARTETLFAPGGTAYVYLCYGIHHLFNVVTNRENVAEAVLIRAIEPVIGVDHMEERRKGQKGRALTSGPGKLSSALGITTGLDGVDLNGERIWITEGDSHYSDDVILSGPRIGVDYAGEDALLPWRFAVGDSPYLSVPVKPVL